MNKEKIAMEKAILHLQNLGLELNEHRANNEYIHNTKYEELLNWSIDAMTTIKDNMELN